VTSAHLLAEKTLAVERKLEPRESLWIVAGVRERSEVAAPAARALEGESETLADRRTDLHREKQHHEHEKHRVVHTSLFGGDEDVAIPTSSAPDVIVPRPAGVA
jgi:hypothetical protein